MQHPLGEGEGARAWQAPVTLWWVGLAGTLCYASLRIAWPEVGEAAGTLMALTGLVAVLTWGKGVRGSGALWLLLGSVVVQLVSWVAGYFHHPQWLPDNPELDRLAKWFLFIGMAWWLGGSTRATLLVWALAVPGFFVALWLEGDGWRVWTLGLAGRRVDFGIHNAQHVAMFFGTALLGLALFSRRCLAAGHLAWSRRLAWLAATTLCLVGVVITQTRAVWLALLASGALTLVMLGYHAWTRSHDLGSRRRLWGGTLAVLIVVVLAGFAFKGTIARRLAAENAVMASILERDWDSVPYSSIGNRIHSWRAALEWIAERPLVGWGGEGRSLVMEHTEWLPEATRQEYGHLHNTFLEVFVAYGVLGIALVAALALWVGRGTWRAWRAGVMPGDMALFAVTFFVFFMIVNQFEAYLSFWSGVYVFNLVMGGLVTHIWRWQLAEARGTQGNEA